VAGDKVEEKEKGHFIFSVGTIQISIYQEITFDFN